MSETLEEAIRRFHQVKHKAEDHDACLACQERVRELEAVIAAAGITGWVTAPDGSIEPQYDTDEEEDVRNEP